MQFRVLGPLEVWGGQGEIAVPAARQRALLASLLLRANEVVAVADLIERIWGPAAPRDARATTQTYVHRLRRVLGAKWIRRRLDGYLISLDRSQLDLARFDDLITQADRTDDPRLEARLLTEALGLWRGPALSNVASDSLHREEVPALTERRLRALQRRIDLDLEAGRHADLVAELRTLTAEFPLRERFWAQLMNALAGSGLPAEALRVYAQLRAQLADELGTDPGSELQNLYQTILRGDVPVATAAVSAVPAQLPPDLPVFAGRSRELKTLDPLVERALSTVVIAAIDGTAGVGKTALALHWAHRVRDRFPDGQLYLNLRGFDPDASPMDPAKALRTFLDALDVPVERIPNDLEAQVGLYRSLLAGRRMLLVLDNVRDAHQVRVLLPGTPGCLVVVTSRHNLPGLITAEGATPLTLDRLPMDEALDLLAGRLGRTRVAVERRAADEIVEHCARLPLALAIVAARAAAHPDFRLASLATELRDSRTRLDALAGGEPASDVRAVLSWSYRALTPDAARLFRLLGLHPGPDISIPAAVSLAGLPPTRVRAALGELARAHLISEHTVGRYVLHDLLRSYAAELNRTLDSEARQRSATHRMLDHYLHTGYAAALRLDPARDPIILTDPRAGVTPETIGDDGVALAWFSTEHSALLAALRVAATCGWDVHAWQLAWTMVDFLYRRGHWQDYTTSQHTALAAAERAADAPAQALAHRYLSRACTWLGRFESAHHHLRAALSLYQQGGDLTGQAHTLIVVAYVTKRQGQLREALDHTQRALQMYRAAGHQAGHAIALNQIGWYHSLLDEHRQALVHCRLALALFQELADRSGQASTWDSLGHAHHHLGQHADAQDCYQQALDLFTALGNRHCEADVLTHIGDAHAAMGHHGAAHRAWRRAMTILEELGHPDVDEVRMRLTDPVDART